MSSLVFRHAGVLSAGVVVVALSAVILGGAKDVSAQPVAVRKERGRADSARIRADIAYLADDRLEGRLTGTPGNDSAAAYLARRLRALRLEPIVQPFTAKVMAFAHAGRPYELATRNVAAIIPGRDRTLRGQYVVLGAHYDHLGRDKTWAQDPQAGDAIRNGADDNASGTAAVLEMARLLAAHPPRRSVVVVAFSGEEEGTLGSQWFVDHAPVPLDSVVAMLNFDMVGRLTNDRLLVYGVGTAAELPAIVDSANTATARLSVKTLPDGVGPSDHTSFYLKDIPVLHFFTDQHPDYHAATDDVEKINAAGEARVVDLAMAVARTLADRPTRLTFQKTAPPRMSMGGPESQGVRPYLGSVPDMAADGAGGLRLAGVTPGSPADRAGLKTGDVVVQLGDKTVGDLYSYTDALYSHKPGDVVTVVVLRAGAAGSAPQSVTVSVTLGKRGE
jgi:hypothetical protein